MLESVRITSFKKITDSEVTLSKLNVFVGGNNSGKSCFLQGIHFGIALSQSRRIAGFEQFPPEQLRYCPTDDFLNLRSGRRLTEGAAINFIYSRANGDVARVALQRGRNGVVKAVYNDGPLTRDISDPKGFFSIYVPGLAGISIREEYRSELVVNNGIARGDANLYLRNVLLRICQDQARKTAFHEYLDQVFPGARVETAFDQANDLWIKSSVSLPGHIDLPLDMAGTGVLQAVQLLAYVTNYSPKLLLLDEPDAHLHPNNQRLLAKTLNIIADRTETIVILATHSRHLLDALSEANSATLYWVKEGTATRQDNWSDVAVLMDLGALDRGERFLAGNYRFLVWTEDSDTRYLEKFLEANGVPMDETLIFSYQASSKIDAAGLMARFVERIRPGVRTIIHRDRDFMTDEEVNRMKDKYRVLEGLNARTFVTKYSDMEAYFAQPGHLHNALGIPLADAQILVETTIRENSNEFVLKFRDKREQIKCDLYRADPNNCPPTDTLLPGNQVPIEKAIGKLLLKRLAPNLQQAGHNGGAILAPSAALQDQEFQALLQ